MGREEGCFTGGDKRAAVGLRKAKIPADWNHCRRRREA
jgi:hypothetical protein